MTVMEGIWIILVGAMALAVLRLVSAITAFYWGPPQGKPCDDK